MDKSIYPKQVFDTSAPFFCSIEQIGVNEGQARRADIALAMYISHLKLKNQGFTFRNLRLADVRKYFGIKGNTAAKLLESLLLLSSIRKEEISKGNSQIQNNQQ
jgi:hypothetical protein